MNKIKNYIINIISKEQILYQDKERILDKLIRNYKIPYIDSKDEIEILYYEKINEYSRNGYFIFRDQDDNICYAINNIAYLKRLPLEKEKIFLVRQKDFFALLDKNFSALNTIKSRCYLESLAPEASSGNVNYKKLIIGFILIYFAGIFLFINLFHLINNLIFFLQNIFKFILFKKALITNSSPYYPPGGLKEYPVYSVFVPLYKEIRKLKTIIAAVDNLAYPKSRLDVKFIIEADDYNMIKALTTLDLPPYIHVIKVPYSLPRTKPKAMNYALNYAIGDYLVIYDAEDRPDSDQLLKALDAFNKLPPDYACVQAKLNFYNADENWLTKFFCIEYSLWFDYLLKGLSLLDLPVTLGGTSNHFKVAVLRKAGCWDAYNVTEDADLGIRLYLNGYKIHIIDSNTLEEAPIELGNWLHQRSRWIKGFIQTFIVFFRARKDYKIFGLSKICSVYIFVGLSTYSFFSLPWLVLIGLTRQDNWLFLLWLINSFFALSYMYSTAFFILRGSNHASNLSPFNWLILLLWPLYFILHTIASYKALWECFTEPFKWNKTEHGVSAKE